jgi:ubiquinone/menaquinone biosynthesis C-methylase UbiE
MSDKKIWDMYWSKDKDYDIKKDPLYNEVMNVLPKNKNSLILEAGCGAGKWLLYFKRIGYKSIGIDFSENGLKKIREKDKRIMLVKGDIRNLPIKNETFDLVFSFGVVEHFRKPQQLINEMHRVVKKNGLLFLDTPNLLSFHTFYRFYRKFRKKWVVGYEDSYTTWQLKKILEKSGFIITDSGTRGRYNKLDIFGFLSFVVGKK